MFSFPKRMISIKCKSATTICSSTSYKTTLAPVLCHTYDKDTISNKTPCEKLGYDSYNCCQSDNKTNSNDRCDTKDTTQDNDINDNE
ncbi:MAG: hypothetical protein WD512_04040 [Candidatus Paceibacterota bacterium]